jgi:hypothetical protein
MKEVRDVQEQHVLVRPQRRALLVGIGILAALWFAPVVKGGAQSVEVLFTPTVLQQAVSLKETLRVPRLESSSALSLVGAAPEKKKAYADKVATNTALVILGEDAVKAVGDIEFNVPVIVVNATGHVTTKGRVIRVFDNASAPSSAQAVSSASAVKGLLGADTEVSLKGPVNTVVQGVLDALK